MSDALMETARGPEYYYAKHSIRIVVSLLLVLYFFKRSVLEYFGLTEINKLKVIGMLVLICIGIMVAFAEIATLVS